MTLPRRSRLSGKAAFSRVFEQASVSSDASFRILGRLSDMSGSRLGMAVSRQVDKRAVQRNRLKRVIRESFRKHYLATQTRAPLDLVVLPRKLAVALDNKTLFEHLSRHWRRIDDRIASTSPTQQA
jgi:ribonuclease P protein component